MKVASRFESNPMKFIAHVMRRKMDGEPLALRKEYDAESEQEARELAEADLELMVDLFRARGLPEHVIQMHGICTLLSIEPMSPVGDKT